MVSADVIEKLPTALRHVSYEQGANAAVALLLNPKTKDFEILLVKRAKHPADPWSGQMALPGGKRNEHDTDLKATVTRETLEETGINLAESRFLGVLNAVQSLPRRDLRILPFVILLEQEPTVKLNRNELEAYMLVPYEKVIYSKGTTTEPGFGQVPAYVLGNAVIWGITYKILTDFAKIVERLSLC